MAPSSPSLSTPASTSASDTPASASQPGVSQASGPVSSPPVIGAPVSFRIGPFADQTIRARPVEIQAAQVGRRSKLPFAHKDRRPIDPPPVVQLRILRVLNAGTDKEVEEEIVGLEDTQVHGLLCHVDLFAAPPPDVTSGTSKRKRRWDDPAALPVANDHIVAHTGDGKPVMASRKCTEYLVGTTVTQAVNIGWQKQRSLMFVFADLSVKVDGFFILRYRCFDIFSRMHAYADPPVFAECFGDRFQIFSTKKFPGLAASTPLTKHIAMWGVRVAVRETPRRRAKGEADGSDDEVDLSSGDA